MVDLGGYVIILVETKDKKIKLYGSPADKDNLEVGDEILEVNGKTLEDATHTEVISHIHQCIRSRTICLRIKRRSGARLALDLDLCSSNVQDAFVIAVEQQARERLERLSALRRVTPIDMNKLSQQLNQQTSSGIIAGGGSIGGSGASGASISSVAEDLNGFISSNSPIYVTSLTASTASTNNNPTGSKPLLVGSTTVVSAAAAAPGAASYQLSAAQAVAAAKLLPNGGHHQSQQQLLERNRVPGVGADLTQQSGAVAGATKVPNDIRVPDIQRGKSIDSTGQVLDVRKLGDRRASSPFQNGRTELLIGADDCKLPKSPLASNSTLATPTETNNNLNKLAVDPELRPRRRSGSSIVVLDGDHHQLGQLAADPVKRGAPLDIVDPVTGTALSDADYNAMVLMLAGDAGPHREMAVDVPDSFVARNKTPPRYPPPKPIIQVGYDRLLGVTFGEDARERAIDVPENFVERKKTPPKYPSQISTKSGLNGTASAVGGQMVGGKPVPPPRDHLKMEVDGRVVNRAPAPQLPARSPISAISNNNNNTAAIVTDTAEPTREQLDSIRKYQEQLRKRKEDEERITAQNEYLNRSLRGSRKLQALESRPQPSPPTGAVNEAFAGEDEVVSAMATTSSRCATPTSSEEEKEVVHTPYGYGELIAAVQRLHLHLKKAGNGHSMGGLGGLEGRVAAVQSVLLSPQFNRALAVHNVVQLVRNRTVGRPTVSSGGALAALRDVVDVVGEAQSGHAVELAALLTGYELEALMAAHDGVATALPEDTGSPISTPTEPIAPSVVDNHVAIPTHHHGYPEENNIKIIKIEKSTEPLGATVRNDGDAVVIGRVVRGGAADKSGLLHEGDELLEVNGIEMRGKSVNAVCDILAAMEGTLTFLVVPAGGGRGTGTGGRDTLLHVRAHFDYDPEEDMYIPCRELGISFQKGDVLHVISQEDSNWWQAYREGEEDQTLAGLVPSQAFQHQREAMRLAAEERLQRPPRKTATLLCGSGKTRKKRSKGVSSGGLESMYASSNDDHEPPDEILTYEEVSLYYPRANNKRPIVLIGPPNIGRHELRQRLMEDGARFAAAVPHTSRARKENERDGHDYHFITRAQFEADILGRRFVEHGEYERAYYGTSINAIRSVVQSGKICVLNLHPQSLRILRTSDLKPYVVFVAPPSLEKLRQKRIRAAEAYKEDELKDTIERAREMEDRYGHLFDMIIINNDTERAYHQLLGEINCLEREPQWVPAAWVKAV